MGRKEITTKEDLMKVIELFENTGITYWLDGGWGVDILAGKQTRIHRDIDINFDAQHTEKLLNVLLNLGYSGHGLVLEEHDIWMNSQMIWGDDATEEIFGCVSDRQDDIESFEDYNACMETVAAYANSLPKWLLRG